MDRQRVATCISLLEEQYGIPHPEETDPVNLLVMTILSQNTSDTNSLRAFALLKSAFYDYEEILKAPDEAVADSIRTGGLGEIKARRIKGALVRIKQDVGAISLSFLADIGKEEAMAYLLSLPGVGLLVMTILSQNTSDTNSLRAFGHLKTLLPIMRSSSGRHG